MVMSSTGKPRARIGWYLSFSQALTVLKAMPTRERAPTA
jgi:hypothetical protein